MSWISIVLLIIKYLPEIIALVKEITDLIDGLKDRQLARRQFSLLRLNIRQAKSSGDFSGLEKQLCWLKDNCRR